VNPFSFYENDRADRDDDENDGEHTSLQQESNAHSDKNVYKSDVKIFFFQGFLKIRPHFPPRMRAANRTLGISLEGALPRKRPKSFTPAEVYFGKSFLQNNIYY
jgi:hypothetical protein